ncbi:hypothetical protein [Nostoc sp. 'Lobaria pulmonaria (5183) cyanobiont']|uniref:hypothetical protein n=1 Tax=Nostoc sp. 'Lobaria pulmonaria (5183) cyanobiont' TaxID=1618022 RepID=UPI000CF30740|nr:hypothetical protein [Nostoc sp. 'Lobaria pulmonaria (5183) cyanobiont']AVH73819.1 hypothetical protein NLP_5521 [Nostoc sp. 'Lobaria pulmonaria (5183) cyanobiont']
MTLPVLHKAIFGAGANDFYYIKTSDAYEGIKAQTGLEKVADPKGTEEIIPVKELLRTGIVWRIGIRYKDSSGKRKSSHLLIVKGKLAGLFGDNAADQLEDKDYKLAGTVKGKIEAISGRRKATFF